MNVKISIHKRNLKVRIKALKDWKIAEQDKKDLIKFLNDLELGKVNKGRKISEARRLKYLDLLKIPLTYFKKPTNKLLLKDVERFEKYLSRKKYSPSTKASIRLMLRTYLKWKLGETEHFHKLTDWFDTREPKRTPDYLKEEEIIKLYRAAKSNEERFLIAVLFDTGARAEEFHNIRMEDIQLPKENQEFVRITFKEEYSKTSGRCISLFWKHSLEAVRDYYEERTKEGAKSNEPIFKNSYDNTRQFLYRIGKKALNKKVHYHLFRHSSATYYAPKLNRQQLCIRYGWKFSSDMPDVYISRAGMEESEVAEKFKATGLEELKKELEQEKQKRKMFQDKIEKIIPLVKEAKDVSDIGLAFHKAEMKELSKTERKKPIKIMLPKRLAKKAEKLLDKSK